MFWIINFSSNILQKLKAKIYNFDNFSQKYCLNIWNLNLLVLYEPFSIIFRNLTFSCHSTYKGCPVPIWKVLCPSQKESMSSVKHSKCINRALHLITHARGTPRPQSGVDRWSGRIWSQIDNVLSDCQVSMLVLYQLNFQRILSHFSQVCLFLFTTDQSLFVFQPWQLDNWETSSTDCSRQST